MRSSFLLACFFVVCLANAGSGQDAPQATPGKQIRVFLTGEVKRQEVCLLPTGAGIMDAIKAAGGFTNDAASVTLWRKGSAEQNRSVARIRIKDLRDGTYKNEVLLDLDVIQVRKFFGSRMY